MISKAEFHRFQNSEYGVVILYQNLLRGKLYIQYAPATNPKKANDIKPGDKIYDYNNSKFFSIGYEEAKKILSYINAVYKTKFKVPEFKITHFPDKTSTHEMSLSCYTSKKGTNMLLMRFIYIDKSNTNVEKTSLTLALNDDQIKIFVDYLLSYNIIKTLQPLIYNINKLLFAIGAEKQKRNNNIDDSVDSAEEIIPNVSDIPDDNDIPDDINISPEDYQFLNDEIGSIQ